MTAAATLRRRPARPYQDRFRNGVTLTAGYRACAERYQIIRPAVSALGPAPSILDFGASDGYFAFRLAHDLGSHATAVDRLESLARAAAANGDGHVRAIVGRLRPAEVAALPRHDVVLALSVLHHNRDWPHLLAALLGRARRLLIVETPDPAEPLRQAVARHHLARIRAVLEALPHTVLGTAPAVRSEHRRTIYAIPCAPALRGTVHTGSGHCSHFWTPAVCRKLTPILGYRPEPGSLNLRLSQPPLGPVRLLLGKPQASFWDQRRVKGGHLGGDYQFWRARFGLGEHAIEAHVMLPGARVHGDRGLELVAPVHLRRTWGLKDGDSLWVRIRGRP